MHAVEEKPVWDEGVPLSRFAKLRGKRSADVAVIGGGITGISTAYNLMQEGYTVALIEKKKFLHGATGVTTAFLTQYIDTEIQELTKMFGNMQAKAILDSHAQAIDAIEQIAAKENISCEFMRCPLYVYAHSPDDIDTLHQERDAAESISVPFVFRKDDALPFAKHGYLQLENQGKFHPLKYLAGLIEVLVQKGALLYEDTEAEDIVHQGKKVVVQTSDGKVVADHAVVATYVPFDRSLFFKKGVYVSYVLEAHVPKGAIPEAIYEDTYNPYHYFRIDRQADHDRMIFGGADHRQDIPVHAEKNFAALEETMKKTFAGIPLQIVGRWSGPIVEPADGVALIGPLRKENVLYATGFSGNGMTYGTIASRIISDAIAGREHLWSALYDARRVPSLKQLAYKGYDYSGELVGGALKNTIRHRSR